LRIRGPVTHDFDRRNGDNLFDFNPDQPGHRAGSILERASEAAPFRMRFDRRQDVDAELIYEQGNREGDKRLTLKRATWGDIR
jgi:hypothetical protein